MCVCYILIVSIAAMSQSKRQRVDLAVASTSSSDTDDHRAASASPVMSNQTFMELGDCLRPICDRLDIDSLCAMAGTCRRMYQTAHDCFVAKKFTTIKNTVDRQVGRLRHRNIVIELGSLYTNDLELMGRVLERFGDVFTEARINFVYEPKLKAAATFERLTRHCGGTLRILHLTDFTELDTVQSVNRGPLFTNLTQLMLKQCDFVHYHLPFATCKHLIRLELIACGYGVVEHCLRTTFAHLESIRLELFEARQADFDGFLQRNKQLTEVSINSTNIDYYASLGQLPLTSVGLGNCGDGNRLINMLNRVGPLHSTLQKFTVKQVHRDENQAAVWQALAMLKQLRQLHIGWRSAIVDQGAFDAMKAALLQMPHMETVTLAEPREGEAAQIQLDIHDWCIARNIELKFDSLAWL